MIIDNFTNTPIMLLIGLAASELKGEEITEFLKAIKKRHIKGSEVTMTTLRAVFSWEKKMQKQRKWKKLTT